MEFTALEFGKESRNSSEGVGEARRRTKTRAVGRIEPCRFQQFPVDVAPKGVLLDLGGGFQTRLEVKMKEEGDEVAKLGREGTSRAKVDFVAVVDPTQRWDVCHAVLTRLVAR